MNESVTVTLKGKVLILAEIRAVTGLRVGGSSEGLKIGGVDARIIRDPWDRPYLPGSSLKGKLRMLLEHHLKVSLEAGAGRAAEHRCKSAADYAECAICRTFGTREALDTMSLTRLRVRDAYLDEDSVKALPAAEVTLSEVKTEIAIDRRTGTTGGRGAGGLRQIERVPAGAIFRPVELVLNVYEEGDKDLLKQVLVALELLEDDYLGGMGSRGYGKVRFENVGIWWNRASDYENGKIALADDRRISGDMKTPSALVRGFDSLRAGLT